MADARATVEDFEFVRLIGKGGMGAVHEVRNKRTGARYAAKILAAETPRARERFRREAELLARCDRHPGIVKVHALLETRDGRQVLVMDLVEGESLAKVIERERKLEPGRAAAIALEVARALAFAHGRGIVHRDVKPENVLLDGAGRPRLGDFGLATARDLERMTQTGQFVGTPLYCAPEQTSRGALEPMPAADVYSAGAVIFEMLAGEPPFTGDSPLAVIQRLADPEPARDVRLLAPSTPPALAAIVARALAKDPRARYADGTNLARDLERFLAGEVADTRPPGTSRRALVVGSVVVAVAAALALVLARPWSKSAADPEVALASARKALAAGDAGQALAELDAIPSPLSLDARVVRARALLLAGRADEARALARDLPSSRIVEAREIDGDALVASKRYAEALLAYGAVVDRGGEELRIKRGRAAALAGDDTTALADFTRLVPDPASLSSDRAANARLAAFAAPLYRRAVRARTFADEERDARIAWRLDAPPPGQEGELLRIWRAELDRMQKGLIRVTPTEREIRATFADWKTYAGLRARIRACEPYDDTLDWQMAGFLRGWGAGVDWATFPDGASLADAVVAEDPTQPFPLFTAGRVREDLPARRLEALELFLRAGEQLPRPRPDEPMEIPQLAAAIADHVLGLDTTLGEQSPLDVERLAPIVSRSASGPIWSRLAQLRAGRGDTAGARADQERAEKLAPDHMDVLDAHVMLEEDPAQILAWARARYEARGGPEDLHVFVHALERARRWAEVVKVVNEGMVRFHLRRTLEEGSLRSLAIAWAELLDFDAAREAVRRLNEGSSGVASSVDEIERRARAELHPHAALAARVVAVGGDEFGLTSGRRRFLAPIALALAVEQSWARGFELALELTVGQDDPDLLVLRARALAGLHRVDEARALARGPLAGRGRGPLEVELIALDAEGRSAEALALVRREHRQSPDVWTLRELAERLVRSGSLDAVVGLVPFPGTTDERTLDALGRALADRRAFGKAFELVRGVAPSDPSRGRLLHSLVRRVAEVVDTLDRDGKKEAARALVRAFQRPDMPELALEDVRQWVSVLFYDLRAYEEVVAFLHGRLEDDLALEYARSLYLLGRTQEARAYVAGIRHASGPFVLGARVAFLLADGKKDEAVALVRPERSTAVGTAALRLLVDFLVERGDHNLVVELVDDTKVGDGWVLEALASSLVAVGRKDDARALGRRLLARGDGGLQAVGAKILDSLGP